MALFKEIELENGVVVNYHRIVSLNKITNVCNMIEIASYTSNNKRDEEQTLVQEGRKLGQAISMNIFIDTTYISKDYDENETIEDAYEYLKTTDKFKDAENA